MGVDSINIYKNRETSVASLGQKNYYEEIWPRIKDMGKEIDLRNLELLYLPDWVLPYLKHANTVLLSGNPLVEAPFPMLNNCPNLKVVDLSKSKIQSVPSYRDGIRVCLDGCPVYSVPHWVINKKHKPSLVGCPVVDLPDEYMEIDPQLYGEMSARATLPYYDEEEEEASGLKRLRSEDCEGMEGKLGRRRLEVED